MTSQYDGVMSHCCELLIAEHRQTEGLMNGLETLLQRMLLADKEPEPPSWLSIRKTYRVLSEDLSRHFLLEEQALFAVLNPYRTMMLMEVEHDDLLVLQADFAGALNMAETEICAETVLSKFEIFKQRLYAHIKEEEQGIFPLAETKLEPEDKIKVLRLYNELLETYQATRIAGETMALVRTTPRFQLANTNLFNAGDKPNDKPMLYQTLYDRENTSVQHICLQAGQKQSPHWAGQHQYLVVLSGQVVFNSAGESHTLVSGDTLTIDSRLVFALSAVKETQLLVFKIWPHPHYCKS
jgi:hemerythrin-like domain-containing protein/quercetin dioxygenase-like cupin family protein